MSILVNKKTRLVVQGITGAEGTFHTKQMIEYGTSVVAGVTPGKGGTLYEGNEKDHFPIAVPIFNTVQEAVQKQTGKYIDYLCSCSICRRCYSGSGGCGSETYRCDYRRNTGKRYGESFMSLFKRKKSVSSGRTVRELLRQERAKVGIMPGFIHMSGHVGIISRSGTLTYEAVDQLTQAWNRPVYVSRYWRRSDYRNTVSRCRKII